MNEFTQDTLIRVLSALEEQTQLLREVRDLLSSDMRAQPPAGSGQQPPQHSTVDPIMTMLAENRSKLYGRMSASQVAAAIGLSMTPQDRTRLGIALTKFGASRVRIVGNVFYTFGGESSLTNLSKIPEGPYRELIDKHIDALKTESPMSVERLGEIVGLHGRPLENLAKVLGPSGALGEDGSYRF